jgi:RNA polymerase sigma-70 factor (ECF subfamily)
MVRFSNPGYKPGMTLRLLELPRQPGPASGSERRATRLETPDPLLPLVAEAAAGNLEAQRTLMVALGPSLLKVVRGVLGSAPMEIEDALQEAMVAVHLALPGFRAESTTLHFACRIAVNTAMNFRRRAGYRARHTPSTSPDEVGRFAHDDDSPAELAAANSRRGALQQLLSELPAAQAEVLALHALLGYTVAETAESTRVPANTVRSRLRNALSKLRERIQGDATLRDTIGGRT